MNSLSYIKLEKHKVLHEQVRDQIRTLILSGKFAPDEKLPSTDRIAALLNTHVPTVHIALTNLVREGLLVRYNGKGTFVRQREEKLMCVGIYNSVSGFRESLYGQALQAALKEELAELGMEMDAWLDPRPEGELQEPWSPFVKAAEHREFQAVIAINPGQKAREWFQQLPVPTAFQSTPDIPNAVGFDYLQFAELSVRVLAEQGCRSIGLIWPYSPESGSGQNLWGDFAERFIGLAHDLGITVRNQWIRLLPHATAMRGRSHESYGYEQFRKVWGHGEKPEGLAVFDDVTARGVILGLREQHVRVPEDLKLVLHKNEAVDLLCPMPATFLISSEREVARTLITLLQKQFRGETCEPIRLPFRQAAHNGSSQQETNEGSQS